MGVKHPSTNTLVGRVVAVGLQYPLPAEVKTFAKRIKQRFDTSDSEAQVLGCLLVLKEGKHEGYGVSVVRRDGVIHRYQVLYGKNLAFNQRAGFMDTEESQLPGTACHTRPPQVPLKWAAEQIIKCHNRQKTKAEVDHDLDGMPESARTACRAAGEHHKLRIEEVGYQEWLKWQDDVEAQCSKV